MAALEIKNTSKLNGFADYFKRIFPSRKIIFIVEDNEVYAKSLKSYIQSHIRGIKEIKNFNIGEMCLMELHREPSVVIMDYFLNTQFKPAYNGLEIIKRIKASRPQTNIIVLSTHEKINDIAEAIKQYGCSYVQKDREAFNKVEQLIKEIFNRKNVVALES
jgi:DNA-binding NarL/FixJ family response regulator